MQKEILLNILTQNRATNSFALDQITSDNADFRLNEQTSSAGFVYRHIGETINLFGTFFGLPTDVENTTMGEAENGQGQDIKKGKKLVEKGYEMLQKLIENMSDADWLEPIETPFFGTIPRIRLFAHILFHSSHHAGQISLILAKGKKY
ncbi:MAG: DinB family protein [Acidobacteriota bacterium]|nr:DinB family protein [Acidobacteriota bacterium]